MGWHEVMQGLEKKVEGTLKGTYRPLDDVPFFRVQYPPAQEREALRQFRQFAERMQHRGWSMERIPLTEVFRETLQHLLGCGPEELQEKLEELERGRERVELQQQLSEHLSQELTAIIVERLSGLPKDGVAVLLRIGALHPFMRSSTLESLLEGRVPCAVVLPYPGTRLGALLDARPSDPHGRYYRGETIEWR